MSRRRALLLGASGGAALALLALLGRGAPGPCDLDARNDACANCRMAVSDARFAAQLVAPSELPRFFDDVGCLRDWLAANPRLPAGAAAFVADHRTKAWVPARRAVYTRSPALETPMASHVIAHADAASRDLDAAASGGRGVPATELFGPAGPPGESP